ncbi:MAG: hypothetical protein QNJ74_28910 [Trichodesmium sp. MO_231.B1]|nr:hypothetical protein [Trichodesmium sp. MO_231.B1]
MRKLKTTGSIYIMAATQYMPYIDIYLRDKITLLSRIVLFGITIVQEFRQKNILVLYMNQFYLG